MDEIIPTVQDGNGSVSKSVILVAVGVLLLVFGADRLVEGAVVVARQFGISERVIGLTMVALGTSLPELAACIAAAMQKECGIILGNVIGSNIFNVLCVLSTAVMIHPLTFDAAAIHIDLIVMMGLSVVILPFMYTGLRLGKRESVVLLASYLTYIVFLFQ